MKDNFGYSSAKVPTKHAALLVSGIELTPRPGIFTTRRSHKMDVLLAD